MPSGHSNCWVRSIDRHHRHMSAWDINAVVNSLSSERLSWRLWSQCRQYRSNSGQINECFSCNRRLRRRHHTGHQQPERVTAHNCMPHAHYVQSLQCRNLTRLAIMLTSSGATRWHQYQLRKMRMHQSLKHLHSQTFSAKSLQHLFSLCRQHAFHGSLISHALKVWWEIGLTMNLQSPKNCRNLLRGKSCMRRYSVSKSGGWLHSRLQWWCVHNCAAVPAPHPMLTCSFMIDSIVWYIPPDIQHSVVG